MVFVFALMLLMTLSLYGFLKPVSGAVRITSQIILRNALLMAAALACASPVLFELYTMTQLSSGKAVSLGQDFWPAYVMLGGATVSMVIYGWILARLRGTQASAMTFGRATIGMAVSIYVLAVFTDHMLFYFQRTDDTGIVDLDTLREITPIKDMACNAPTALIRLEHNQGPVHATFRCPTTLLVGRYTTAPMLPWPSYTEGTSVGLAKAINDLRRGAEQ